MRDWSVAGAEKARPAHASAWARFPRWPSVAAAVAIPAAMAVAFLAPLHGSVHQHTATHPADVVTQPIKHDFQLADADASSYIAPPPTEAISYTTYSAGSSATTAPLPVDAAAVSPLAADGIPSTALAAYMNAATLADAQYPQCQIPWPLLAGIGRVESDHGRFGGAVLYSDGTSSHKIIGIPLDGSRSATITDTDHGALDGDKVYDRAVGPMQFIPSTWASYGADGNGDGKKDPFNIFDAARAAADYLCVAGGNLSTVAGQSRAVLAYNHSSAYLAEVLALEQTYASGAGVVVPVGPPPPPPTTEPTLPPVDPGPPLGRPHPGRPSGSPTPSSSAPTSSASSSSSSPSAPPTSSPAPSSSAAPSCASPTDPSTSDDPSSPVATRTAPSFTFPRSPNGETASASLHPTDAESAHAESGSASSTGSSTASSTASPTPSPTPSCTG